MLQNTAAQKRREGYAAEIDLVVFEAEHGNLPDDESINEQLPNGQLKQITVREHKQNLRRRAERAYRAAKRLDELLGELPTENGDEPE